ncbi:unnamed protein product, partial [Ectocarpus sp. 8 AP-2014]
CVRTSRRLTPFSVPSLWSKKRALRSYRGGVFRLVVLAVYLHKNKDSALAQIQSYCAPLCQKTLCTARAINAECRRSLVARLHRLHPHKLLSHKNCLAESSWHTVLGVVICPA